MYVFKVQKIEVWALIKGVMRRIYKGYVTCWARERQNFIPKNMDYVVLDVSRPGKETVLEQNFMLGTTWPGFFVELVRTWLPEKKWDVPRMWLPWLWIPGANWFFGI